MRKFCKNGSITLSCVLLTQGIPAPLVFEIFDEALSLCENTLLTLTLPLSAFHHKVAAALSNKEPPLQTPPPLSPFPALPSNHHSCVSGSGLNAVPAGEQKASPASNQRRERVMISPVSNQKRDRVMLYSRHFSTATANSQQLQRDERRNQTGTVTSSNGTPSARLKPTWIAAVGLVAWTCNGSGRPLMPKVLYTVFSLVY